jgi:hypothetical protein
MASSHVLAPFVCGRSLRKRRVDQHKRMQLILGPRWLVPPLSALCNRPPLTQWLLAVCLFCRGFEKHSTRVSCHRSVTHKCAALHPTAAARPGGRTSPHV